MRQLRHFEHSLTLNSLNIRYILNLDDFRPYDEDFMSIKVFDYSQSFGVYIDRQMNKDYGMQLKKVKDRNYKQYIHSIEKPPPFMTQNVQLLLRIETRLKLNLISNDG